ncbi:hypothetical protein Pmani_017784 [Petrolisthes manimaculis]|uniref:Uncharacterized protein n=1 Tax=Petrolisthes manimaculis TaxID=1843537 RepID=A0AAE1U9G8_9EUCA|nr:hypothetical protein Pmani_017784 [Petrolisthes manimaculis]
MKPRIPEQRGGTSSGESGQTTLGDEATEASVCRRQWQGTDADTLPNLLGLSRTPITSTHTFQSIVRVLDRGTFNQTQRHHVNSLEGWPPNTRGPLQPGPHPPLPPPPPPPLLSPPPPPHPPSPPQPPSQPTPPQVCL